MQKKRTYRLTAAFILLAMLVLSACSTGPKTSGSPYVRERPDSFEMQSYAATLDAEAALNKTAAAEFRTFVEATRAAVAATSDAHAAATAGAILATAQEKSFRATDAVVNATGTALHLEAQAAIRRATETAKAEMAALAATATRVASEAEREAMSLQKEQDSQWIDTRSAWVTTIVGLILIGGVVGLFLLALYRAIEVGHFRGHIVGADQNGIQPANYLQKPPHAVHDPDQLNRLVRGGYGAQNARQQALKAPSVYDMPQISTTAPETPPAALPEKVTLRALLNGERPRLNHLVLGISQEGLVYGDLEKLIHILVGGSTRFGKSNFLRTLAYQLAVSPEAPELVIADIEAVTFGAFTNCGRLRYPLATEPDEITRVFEDLNGELTRRRDLFARFPTVDTLSSYNALQFDQAPLPPVVVMVDEITALLKHSDVGPALEMLALRGGKFGLWVCASGQDLKTSTIDSATRNQFATRLQFGAMDPTQSRVLVGTSEAAKIRTPGRAVAWLPGRGDVEIQTPYVTTREIMTAFTNGHGGGPLHPLPDRDEPDTDGILYMPPEPPTPTDPVDRVAQKVGCSAADVRAVLKLSAEGMGVTPIARRVFGHGAGTHFYRVKAILEAWERENEPNNTNNANSEGENGPEERTTAADD